MRSIFPLPLSAFLAILTGNAQALRPRKGFRPWRHVASFADRRVVFGIRPLRFGQRVGARPCPQAEDLDHSRKTAQRPDRASEVVQRTPDFALWDTNKKLTPSGAGHMFIVEKTDGNRWLLSDLNEGLRGWVLAGTVVPLAEAEAFFSQQIKVNPKSAFAFLMRGVVRYENDDLDHAVADLDQGAQLDPKYVPALIERAYLWQWRNQLDEAVADVSKAIELDPRNSYAFVERGVFEYNRKEYDKALRDFQSAIDLGSQTAVIYIARGMIF